MATELEKLVVRIEADLSKLKSGMREAEVVTRRGSTSMSRSFAAANKSIASLIGGVTRLVGTLGIVGGAAGLVGVTRAVIKQGDAYSLLLSRLKLVTASEKDLVSAEESLFQVSQRTRVGFEETANLFTRLARSSEELGLSQSELIGVTETINQAIITSGASATEASAGLIQFSQGLASGTLRGDELRSVLEQLPRLARAIADGLGITVGELRELGSAGALTGEQVLRAIQSQAGQIAKEFAEIDRTAAQAFTQLESAFLRAAGISADTAGGTEQVVAAIDGLREVVEDPAFQAALTDIVTFFVDLAAATAEIITTLGDFKRAWDESAIGSFVTFLNEIDPTLLAWRALRDAMAEAREEADKFTPPEGLTIPLPPIAPPVPVSPVVPPELTLKPREKPLGIENAERALQRENEVLAKQLQLFGQSSIEIDRQVALLQAKHEFGEAGARVLEDEINAQAELLTKLEARNKAEEDLQRIKDVQIRTNEELRDSTLDLQGAGTAFAGSISSAFEDAIIAGASLSDVIEGLEDDMIRLLGRVLILEPLERGLRTGLGAFEEPAAGGPGGIEGLLGGGLTGLADLFGFEGPGTRGAFEASIGREIGGAGSEFISGDDAEAIFGDLSESANELGFAFEDAKAAASSAGQTLGGDLVSEVVGTIGTKAAETGVTQTTITALGELTGAAFTAAAALNAMAVSSSGGALANTVGGLGSFGGSNPLELGFSGNPHFHAGGVVGHTPAPIRGVPYGTFRGAPRLHNGGIPGLAADEVPAILQRGEQVIPRGGGGGDIHLHGVRDFSTFKQNMPQFRGQLAELQDRGQRRDA
jgi:tape measure domain-containing protein